MPKEYRFVNFDDSFVGGLPGYRFIACAAGRENGVDKKSFALVQRNHVVFGKFAAAAVRHKFDLRDLVADDLYGARCKFIAFFRRNFHDERAVAVNRNDAVVVDRCDVDMVCSDMFFQFFIG